MIFIAGMEITPAIILPFLSNAMKLEKNGTPRIKFFVMSSGSIIHLYSEPVCLYVNSSAKILWSGKDFLIIETIFLSDSLSALVTGDWSDFISILMFLR